MADTVSISSFSDEIQKMLAKYGEEVQQIANEEVIEVSKEAVKLIKQKSPKDQGDYAKGWKMKKKEGRLGIETTIYNSTHGWLVHLLENGHLKRNGTDRTKEKPHVKPVQDWVGRELIKRIKDKL